MKTITTLSIMLTAACGLQAQQHTETVNKELQFEKRNASNVLYLANISGHMDVEGYDGNVIQVEAKIKLMAKTQSRLDEAKESITIGVLDRMDTIAVYATNPCSTYTNERSERGGNDGWGYNWNNQKDCHYNYDYKVDFKVRVPRNVNLVVSTVNDGDVIIAGVDGNVKANNVNGSIALSHVSNATYAHTINGDVTLDFKANPTENARFYSLNGDIRANYLSGLSAEMSFKSFNGDFYTNIPSLEQMPNQLKMEKSSKGRGIAYKLDGKTMMRVRSGGIYLDFETFNGDVYVKEN